MKFLVRKLPSTDCGISLSTFFLLFTKQDSICERSEAKHHSNLQHKVTLRRMINVSEWKQHTTLTSRSQKLIFNLN